MILGIPLSYFLILFSISIVIITAFIVSITEKHTKQQRRKDLIDKCLSPDATITQLETLQNLRYYEFYGSKDFTKIGIDEVWLLDKISDAYKKMALKLLTEIELSPELQTIQNLENLMEREKISFEMLRTTSTTFSFHKKTALKRKMEEQLKKNEKEKEEIMKEYAKYIDIGERNNDK